jgi:hypothetical protein
MTLNLAVEDAADDLVFNEIIWKSVKGADSPLPAAVRGAFSCVSNWSFMITLGYALWQPRVYHGTCVLILCGLIQ